MSAPLCKDCKWSDRHPYYPFCWHPNAVTLNLATGDKEGGSCRVLRDHRYDHLPGKCGSVGNWFGPRPVSRPAWWKFWRR